VARNCVEDVRPLAEEKEIQLIQELPQELPQICGAPNRLQQVITNLLSNAIKFTPSQGMISLRLRDTEDGIQTEVTDTGIGISAAELPKIFDDFYRGGDLEKSGAGLGLAISRRIVEAHGGKIWAESPCPESGKGSKLTFTLPKVGSN
jgi:signal transduction histidine kinase